VHYLADPDLLGIATRLHLQFASSSSSAGCDSNPALQSGCFSTNPAMRAHLSAFHTSGGSDPMAFFARDRFHLGEMGIETYVQDTAVQIRDKMAVRS
jgi:hypothetical protein